MSSNADLLAELQGKRRPAAARKPKGPPRAALAAQKAAAEQRKLMAGASTGPVTTPNRELVAALAALKAECGRGASGNHKLASALGLILLHVDALVAANAVHDTTSGRDISVDGSFNMRLGKLKASKACLEALGFSLVVVRSKQFYRAGKTAASIRRLRAMATSKELIVLFAEGDSTAIDARLDQLEKPSSAAKGGSTKTLHVGGIQGEIEDEAKLQELFTPFGQVETVTLRRRREGTKVSWALVTFVARDGAARALSAQGSLAEYDLVVRAVDDKQAGSSTGAMAKTMKTHTSKFTQLAQQRREQRQAANATALKATAAADPAASRSAGDRPVHVSLAELARQRKAAKQRQGQASSVLNPSEKQVGTTLHVGGIQGNIEDEAKLQELFAQYGAVETVTLRRRREGKKVSWALIAFAEPASAAKALADKGGVGGSGLLVRAVDSNQASSSTGAM